MGIFNLVKGIVESGIESQVEASPPSGPGSDAEHVVGGGWWWPHPLPLIRVGAVSDDLEKG